MRLSGSRSDLPGLGEPGEQSGFEEEEGTQVPILLGDVVNRASFVDAGRDDGAEDEHLAVVVVALQMGVAIQNERRTHDRRRGQARPEWLIRSTPCVSVRSQIVAARV